MAYFEELSPTTQEIVITTLREKVRKDEEHRENARELGMLKIQYFIDKYRKI